jgi:hypothetical protein
MVVGIVRCYKNALRYQSRHFTARARHLAQDDDIQLARRLDP